MSWMDLLASEGQSLVIPWTGPRKIYGGGRTFTIEGRMPREFGWHRFSIDGGRTAKHLEPADPDYTLFNRYPKRTGYIVGNRFIPDDFISAFTRNIDEFLVNTRVVFLVERGLEIIARVRIIDYEEDQFIYWQQEFPTAADAQVVEAFQDRKNLDDIKEVTPALKTAYDFLNWNRDRQEAIEREQARIRLEEQQRLERERVAAERRERARTLAGDAAGRRELAVTDFRSAARAALAVTGAELIDWRTSYQPGENIVRFRYQGHRIECTVHAQTLRIVDSGICLAGRENDVKFTLESLPAVVSEAIRTHRLVIFRHG